ncbi:MAG: transcription antitermination factor NusB [Pseudomonadota bacterium]
MKSPRRRAREFALQALYQWQVAGPSWAEIKKQYADADGFDKADAGLFNTIVKGAIAEATKLSTAFAPHLDRAWAEVSPVERSVMLMGGFELSFMPETPYRVIINEAIELAKSFGGTDGHKYVNGVLDKYALAVRADEVAAPYVAKAATLVKVAKVVAKVTKKVAATKASRT